MKLSHGRGDAEGSAKRQSRAHMLPAPSVRGTKFHIVCLPRLCPSPELPSPSSFYICHAGCLAAYRAGADKRVHCKVDGCDHTKGFANAKALRVHIKTAHEHVTYPCSLCDQPFTSKANCDSHRVNCVRNLTSALQRQRELVLSELQHTA
jgi:hypothetical protein